MSKNRQNKETKNKEIFKKSKKNQIKHRFGKFGEGYE